MEEQLYNGFKIEFDDEEEVWYTLIDEEGKPTNINSRDTRTQDTSLKKLKEKLDLLKRKKFERRPVLIVASRNYRYGHGEDKKYERQYTEGTMTSVSPSGIVFVVPKGEKHAERYNISVNRYSDDDPSTISVYEDNAKNRKIIEEIEAAGEAEWMAEVAMEKARKKLVGISGQKLYKEIYGKTLQ